MQRQLTTQSRTLASKAAVYGFGPGSRAPHPGIWVRHEIVIGAAWLSTWRQGCPAGAHRQRWWHRYSGCYRPHM